MKVHCWLAPRKYGLANICGFLARGLGVCWERKSLWRMGEAKECDISSERMMVSFESLLIHCSRSERSACIKHLYTRYVSLLF